MSASAKCRKCNRRNYTGKDKLCDSCRFVLILDGALEERTVTAKQTT